MADQKPAEHPARPTSAGSRASVGEGPRLIRAANVNAMAFVHNVQPQKPLVPVRGSKLIINAKECRVWIDAQGRAFAILYGEDPNE